MCFKVTSNSLVSVNMSQLRFDYTYRQRHHFFVPFNNGSDAVPWCCLQNIKKIKGTPHKNGDVDGKCKRGFRDKIPA